MCDRDVERQTGNDPILSMMRVVAGINLKPANIGDYPSYIRPAGIRGISSCEIVNGRAVIDNVQIPGRQVKETRLCAICLLLCPGTGQDKKRIARLARQLNQNLAVDRIRIGKSAALKGKIVAGTSIVLGTGAKKRAYCHK